MELDRIWEHPEVIRMLSLVGDKNIEFKVHQYGVFNTGTQLVDKQMYLVETGLYISEVFYKKLIKEVNLKYERDQKLNQILNGNQ